MRLETPAAPGSAQCHLQVQSLAVTEQVDGDQIADQVATIDVAEEDNDVRFQRLAVSTLDRP